MSAFNWRGPSEILKKKDARRVFTNVRENRPQNFPPISLPGSSKQPRPAMIGPSMKGK